MMLFRLFTYLCGAYVWHLNSEISHKVYFNYQMIKLYDKAHTDCDGLQNRSRDFF